MLLNVSGTAGSMQNFAFFLSGGVVMGRVLFNFPQYTALTLNSIGVLGSVFAPRADVNFAGGNLDGTLVARSLTGAGEPHHYPFQSSCPVSSSPAYTVTVQSPDAGPAPKFFVVGGGQASRFTAAGGALATSPLAAGGTATGVAANASGTATWVVTAIADGTTAVTQYDADGSVRNSWRTHGVTDARDIGTNGTNVCVVGKATGTGTFKVFRDSCRGPIRLPPGPLDRVADQFCTPVNPGQGRPWASAQADFLKPSVTTRRADGSASAARVPGGMWTRPGTPFGDSYFCGFFFEPSSVSFVRVRGRSGLT